MPRSNMNAPATAGGGEAGFFLPDALVAVTFLVIAVLALASTALSASKLRRSIGEKRLALNALEAEIDNIEATPFNQIQASHHNRGFLVDPDGTGISRVNALPADADGMPGLITVTVPNPPNRANLLLDVQVVIDWNSVSGSQQLSRTVRICKSGASR